LSAWRVALLTNLGLSYYHYGYFSRALDAWERAWKAGRNTDDVNAQPLEDRAVGELARMHARLGHSERLKALFKELGDRHVTGPATEAIAGAMEGLWMMQNEPGTAYLCGPMALRNLLVSRGASGKATDTVDAYRSGTSGVSLDELDRLADRVQ